MYLLLDKSYAKSLCYIFNSPPGLVSRNYDCLWCLPAYLFCHQKGIVLHFCVQLLFPALYPCY